MPVTLTQKLAARMSKAIATSTLARAELSSAEPNHRALDAIARVEGALTDAVRLLVNPNTTTERAN